jgi:glycosyltransferase involved in cell wall biosynthesis
VQRVLIITYYWPPAGGPGVQRWLKFAKFLPDFNIEPIILTVNPDKATYPLQDKSLLDEIDPKLEVYHTDTFEPFGAYQKTTGRKEVPFSGFANESDKPGPRQKIAKFIRGNFFLPDARKGWNKYALKKAKQIIEQKRIQTVITTGPPQSTHLIGKKLKKHFNLNWIADFRDPWTDIYYYNELYPTALAKQIDRSMERAVIEQANVVSTVSVDMKRLLSSKTQRKSDEQFAVLPNGFDEHDFLEWQEANNELFTISYVGTLTHKYRIEGFLNAAEELSKEGKAIKLVFAGKQDEIVQKQLAGLKYTQVELPGYIAHSEALRLLEQSDALLLAIPDLPDNKGILTGKLFEYLAAKRSIICLGPKDGDAANIIEQANAGSTFEYGDEKGIRDQIKASIERWEQKEKPVMNTDFIESFSRRAITGQMANIIQQFS